MRNLLIPLRLVVTLAALATLISCSSANLPDYTVLGNLRILTIIANTPEVNPGSTVTFTPVLSDLNGQGRTLNYTVAGCMDPGVSVGVTPACPNPDPGTVLSGTVTPPSGTSMTYTGPVPSFSIVMPSSTEAFANASTAQQYNGVAYLIIYSVSSQDGTASVNSFVRTILSTSSKTQKNQNPVISSVNYNDVPISGIFSMPTTPQNFNVITPSSSAETYSVMQSNGSLVNETEQLINTWFISDGSFTYDRTVPNSENSWTPPAPKPSSRGLVILVVTRDGRDGATFQKIEMD